MDGRNHDEAAHTGALPVAGTEVVPVASQPTVAQPERPAWISARRTELTEPGHYLAYEESGNQFAVRVGPQGARIGRSLSADIRFDDATVSRRHALVVADGDGDGVRVLDDRSLNGVLLNGRRVEMSPLADGDQITVGRHSLYFLDVAGERPGASGPAEPAVAADEAARATP